MKTYNIRITFKGESHEYTISSRSRVGAQLTAKKIFLGERNLRNQVSTNNLHATTKEA